MRNTKPGPGEMFIRELTQPWPETCIMWPLSTNTVSGYGQVVFGRKKMPSHRASALTTARPHPRNLRSPIPAKNRACCNPRHLSWKTRAANHADKWAHGTMPAGESHTKSKLTEAKVRHARQMAGSVTHDEIAAMFGVSRAAVSMAIERKTWAHVR